MKAFILINIRPGSIREVVKNLKRTESVVDVNMTFGPYDAIAILKTEDITHLGRILSSEIQPIPGITQTLTCLAVED